MTSWLVNLWQVALCQLWSLWTSVKISRGLLWTMWYFAKSRCPLYWAQCSSAVLSWAQCWVSGPVLARALELARCCCWWRDAHMGGVGGCRGHLGTTLLSVSHSLPGPGTHCWSAQCLHACRLCIRTLVVISNFDLINIFFLYLHKEFSRQYYIKQINRLKWNTSYYYL